MSVVGGVDAVSARAVEGSAMTAASNAAAWTSLFSGKTSGTNPASLPDRRAGGLLIPFQLQLSVRVAHYMRKAPTVHTSKRES